MHGIVQHLVLMMFAVGFCAIGWFMAHNPVRVYRFFTLGGTGFGEGFAIGVFKVVGWCFTVVFAVGTIMHLILTLWAMFR